MTSEPIPPVQVTVVPESSHCIVYDLCVTRLYAVTLVVPGLAEAFDVSEYASFTASANGQLVCGPAVTPSPQPWSPTAAKMVELVVGGVVAVLAVVFAMVVLANGTSELDDAGALLEAGALAPHPASGAVSTASVAARTTAAERPRSRVPPNRSISVTLTRRRDRGQARLDRGVPSRRVLPARARRLWLHPAGAGATMAAHSGLAEATTTT